MNLFAYDPDPYLCSLWLDDVRLNKMITETGQMFTANLDYLMYGAMQDKFSSCRIGYPASVLMHPCTRWMRQSPDNMYWAYRLNTFYLDRWDASHASERIMPAVKHYLEQVDQSSFDNPSNFCNAARSKALNLDFTGVHDTHIAYQMYHTERWSRESPTWNRNGKRPGWYHG